MFALRSESDLVGCFRRIDRREVELAPDMKLPIVVHDVVAWSVGPRAFLLFRDDPDAPPRGLVFTRNAGVMSHLSAMCEWCHVSRGAGAIKLMSVAVTRRRSLGVFVCSDLDCLNRARDLPGRDFGGETLRRIRELAARVYDPAPEVGAAGGADY
jgi:hypothetical protein